MATSRDLAAILQAGKVDLSPVADLQQQANQHLQQGLKGIGKIFDKRDRFQQEVGQRNQQDLFNQTQLNVNQATDLAALDSLRENISPDLTSENALAVSNALDQRRGVLSKRGLTQALTGLENATSIGDVTQLSDAGINFNPAEKLQYDQAVNKRRSDLATQEIQEAMSNNDYGLARTLTSTYKDFINNEGEIVSNINKSERLFRDTTRKDNMRNAEDAVIAMFPQLTDENAVRAMVNRQTFGKDFSANDLKGIMSNVLDIYRINTDLTDEDKAELASQKVANKRAYETEVATQDLLLQKAYDNFPIYQNSSFQEKVSQQQKDLGITGIVKDYGKAALGDKFDEDDLGDITKSVNAVIESYQKDNPNTEIPYEVKKAAILDTPIDVSFWQSFDDDDISRETFRGKLDFYLKKYNENVANKRRIEEAEKNRLKALKAKQDELDAAYSGNLKARQSHNKLMRQVRG